jgi:nicotinate-nucleotide--dimethylbenzimidazole phosphoribosyltransferase
MRTLEETIGSIPLPDAAAARAAQARLDAKTKPPGSLGRLEELACALAAIRGTAELELPRKALVVMAGDHGVAEEGVSAFPQEVTGQMVLNFVQGGAGVNVLGRQAGAEVIVVDMGVRSPLPPNPRVRSVRIGPGTRNLSRGPAMTREETVRALEAGIEIARGLADGGVTLVGLGEMGIANTTPASALVAAYLGLPPEDVTGRGTGIDDEGRRRKIAAIQRGLELARPDPADPLGTFAALGGFELAGLAGVAIGCAARRIPVLMDGFISTAAALAATRIAPPSAYALLASHASVEPGHRAALAALDRRPLLDLGLRLGEGTGAALAMHLVEAAVRIVREMATFASAGVSGAA